MRRLNAIFLVLALILLVYFLHKVGWTPIARGFARVGWGFLVPLGVFLGQFFAETWNWGRCYRRAPAYRKLLVPFWCGQSINLLTPGSSIGEATKGGMLASMLPSDVVVSGLIIYNVAYTYGLVIIMFAASVSLWLLPGMPNVLRIAGSGVAVAIGLGLLTFHCGLVLGRVSRLVARVGRAAGLKKLVSASGHVERWEAEIRAHRADLPLRFYQLVAVAAATQCIPIVELWATWQLLGVKLSLPQCLIFGGMDTLVKIVFSVVPGLVGVAEGTNYYASGMLSLDPNLGVTRQLIGRCVRLLFASAGALVLAWHTARKPTDPASVAPRAP